MPVAGRYERWRWRMASGRCDRGRVQAASARAAHPRGVAAVRDGRPARRSSARGGRGRRCSAAVDLLPNERSPVVSTVPIGPTFHLPPVPEPPTPRPDPGEPLPGPDPQPPNPDPGRPGPLDRVHARPRRSPGRRPFAPGRRVLRKIRAEAGPAGARTSKRGASAAARTGGRCPPPVPATASLQRPGRGRSPGVSSGEPRAARLPRRAGRVRPPTG